MPLEELYNKQISLQILTELQKPQCFCLGRSK